MSSYLDSQLSAFKNSVSSSSTKLSTKRTVNGSTNRTSTPPLTSQSSKNDLKRKRPEPSVPYSQPRDTGTGKNIMTQVTYAVEYLKSKSTPQSLGDILAYLSMNHQGDDFKRVLNTILVNHEKVQYHKNNNEGEGTFQFRPVHNIRSKETLQEFLQSRHSAQGLSVRELRDGWPGAEAAIDELEMEGELLVTRNKKDNHPRMVWYNDASLTQPIDDEFQALWNKIRVPDPKSMSTELERLGQTPISKSKDARKVIKQDNKKKKKPRRGGKTTNTHMAGILRDYSHLKK